MRSEKSDHIGSGRVKTNTGPKTDRQTDRQTDNLNQLQINFKFLFQSLTSGILYSMENLAIDSLLR